MKNLMKISGSMLLAATLAAPFAVAAQDTAPGKWGGYWLASDKESKFPGPAPALDQVYFGEDGTVYVYAIGRHVQSWYYKPLPGQFAEVTGRPGVKIKVEKVDEFNYKQTWDNNGVISESHATLSRDGKTQTFYAAPGKDTNGNPFNEVVVYHRK